MDGLVPRYLPFVRPSRVWLQILGFVYRWIVRVERPLLLREAFDARLAATTREALRTVLLQWSDVAFFGEPPPLGRRSPSISDRQDEVSDASDSSTDPDVDATDPNIYIMDPTRDFTQRELLEFFVGNYRARGPRWTRAAERLVGLDAWEAMGASEPTHLYEEID